MTPYIWDKEIFRFEEARRQSSIGGVLINSDMIVVCLPDIEENKKILSKDKIFLIREGAAVVNLSGRNLIDEKALAQALEDGRVGQYLYEADRLKPLLIDKTENALGFKKLSGHTREPIARSKQRWVVNISNMAGHHTS